MLRQDRIDARDQVLVGGVILDANGENTAALSSRLGGQLHPVHVGKQAFE